MDADDQAQEPGELAEIPGWQRLPVDEELGITTEIVPIGVLLRDADAAVERLREAAGLIVEALRH